MKILIACECSGTVRDAFLRYGHNAYFCDLKDTQSTGPHYKGDVRDILYEPWDMLIAHPTCRYLTNSGVRWLSTDPNRWALMLDACRFFKLFDEANHIPLRAVENPVMHGHALKYVGRRADQYCQPWMFGDPFKKMTGLWLHGLPKLVPTHTLNDYVEEPKQAVWLMGPSIDREEKRSKFYPCFAETMAQQWGCL